MVVTRFLLQVVGTTMKMTLIRSRTGVTTTTRILLSKIMVDGATM